MEKKEEGENRGITRLSTEMYHSCRITIKSLFNENKSSQWALYKSLDLPIKFEENEHCYFGGF